jgi:hypothetical protein
MLCASECLSKKVTPGHPGAWPLYSSTDGRTDHTAHPDTRKSHKISQHVSCMFLLRARRCRRLVPAPLWLGRVSSPARVLGVRRFRIAVAAHACRERARPIQERARSARRRLRTVSRCSERLLLGWHALRFCAAIVPVIARHGLAPVAHGREQLLWIVAAKVKQRLPVLIVRLGAGHCGQHAKRVPERRGGGVARVVALYFADTPRGRRPQSTIHQSHIYERYM